MKHKLLYLVVDKISARVVPPSDAVWDFFLTVNVSSETTQGCGGSSFKHFSFASLLKCLFSIIRKCLSWKKKLWLTWFQHPRSTLKITFWMAYCNVVLGCGHFKWCYIIKIKECSLVPHPNVVVNLWLLLAHSQSVVHITSNAGIGVLLSWRV